MLVRREVVIISFVCGLLVISPHLMCIIHVTRKNKCGVLFPMTSKDNILIKLICIITGDLVYLIN